MHTKIEGLHLWAVKLNGSTEQLWITTRRPDLRQAHKKAVTFLRRKKLNHTIHAVESHGTLDA